MAIIIAVLLTASFLFAIYLRHSSGAVDDADVISMTRQGNMVDAIRMYRELHGTDLKTAKDAVDALAKTLAP